MPLLTLFTAPKPFTDPHISMIQRNTLRNWTMLGEDVEVVVVGDETGIATVCNELDILHIPDVECNALGTPLISSIFNLARGVNDSPYLVYGNADILFLPQIIDSVHLIAEKKNQFLAVGQRWDLNITTLIDFSNDWDEKLMSQVYRTGVLHGQTGSDYFIYPRACFSEIPDFAVGRAGWDNWMIFRARWKHWPVIDLTAMLAAIHQNHDYAHLPGGIIHYHQPETADNVRLAGGRRAIFKLSDATHYVADGKLQSRDLNWAAFWREVEIFPLVWLHSKILGWLSFALFHPIKAFNVIKGWLAYKFNHQL